VGNKRPVASLNTREYDELIALLKEVRREKGVSQEQLSELLGQSVNFVLKIEHKDRRIDVVEFYNLIRALGVDPCEVFNRFAARLTKNER